MLKTKRDLLQLEEGSSDIYVSTRFDEYLYRPQPLKDITYPDFFKWWRKLVVMNIRKVKPSLLRVTSHV